MTTALFAASDANWQSYQDPLKALFANRGLDIALVNKTDAPLEVDYIIYAPSSPLQDFSPFKNVKLVQSLWAGVEQIVANKTMTYPLARMVDPGMSAGMADYVLGHVLYHHLGIGVHRCARAGEWLENTAAPLSSDRTVGFLGLGALGKYCAHAVAKAGFNTVGWSRTQKTDDVVTCYSGTDGLAQVLGQSDILVLLLPDTPATTNIINAQSIAQMKHATVLINPGRGPLIDDAALIAALDTGQISGATLDVFRTEPLPADHPFWHHDKVLITPHIASETRIKTASEVVVDNIYRGQMGQPFLHLVDPARGY